MKADDLSSLFRQNKPQIGLHLGKVVAWNTSTGENTIDALGTRVTNLPMLNIGDATSLRIGDTVAIMKMGDTWFIFGRVINPGSSSFASASLAFLELYQDNGSLALTSTETDLVTATVTVPGWANRAVLYAHIDLVASNSGGTAATMYTRVNLPGGNGAQSYMQVVAGAAATLGASNSRYTEVTPGGTVSAVGRGNATGGSFPNSAFNQAHMTGFVIFSRV